MTEAASGEHSQGLAAGHALVGITTELSEAGKKVAANFPGKSGRPTFFSL